MPFLAVITVVLLFLAALGQSFWWREAAARPWNGNAAFAWGVFCLALYVTWPTIRTLL